MHYKHIFLLFITTILSQNTFASHETIQQQFKIQHAQLFCEYPELFEQLFEMHNNKEISSLNDYKVKFKNVASEAKESGKIIASGMISAIAYGIMQDQVTARICLEYFSKGFHQQMINSWGYKGILGKCRSILENSDSPTVHGLIWGTVATWWVGLPFGCLTAASARLGTWPKVTLKELIKPIGITLAGVGSSAFIAGTYGYFSHKAYFQNMISQTQPDAILQTAGMEGVAAKNWLGFVTNHYAHAAAYATAAIGGLALVGYTIHKRYKKHIILKKLIAEFQEQLNEELEENSKKI